MSEPVLERKPIALSGSTVIMVTILRGHMFEDLWCWDYEDNREIQRQAARELMQQINDECSINFLWELRDAIKEQIEEHNISCGTNFPPDRPEDVD